MISTLLAAHGILQAGSTEVTVYNQGLGFIKDVRNVHLAKGTQNVVIEDVAQRIDATSVGFRCLNNPGSVSILEQNYQYDLVSPEAILQKSVGKKIQFTRTVGRKKESVTGTLISSPTSVVNTGKGSDFSYNGLVIRTDDGHIILSPEGEIDVMEMPEGLIAKPSLLWQVDSDLDQDAKMELSYLTQGMKWNANYVLTLGQTGTADLQGWVTLDNQSGASFNDATLKLLAGEVNVVREQPVFKTVAGIDFEDAAPRLKKREMTEASLFEYHLYTLNRPATIRNKESKQLSLLEGHNVQIKKVLTINGYIDLSNQVQKPINQSAEVRIQFVNNEKSHLGMPMPAGKIRLYQRDANGSSQFLGEDQIQHTPRDEKISLNIGRAFDVVSTRKRTAFKQTGKKAISATYEIEIRNRKKEATSVDLIEYEPYSWKIVSKSQEYEKLDSNSWVFHVNLKAGEVKTVKYTVEARW